MPDSYRPPNWYHYDGLNMTSSKSQLRKHGAIHYNNNQWCSGVYRVLDQQRLF